MEFPIWALDSKSSCATASVRNGAGQGAACLAEKATSGT